MSTAPLNRDKQIELMRAAPKRLDDLIQKWKDNETVSAMLSEPHAELAGAEAYSLTSEKIACLG